MASIEAKDFWDLRDLADLARECGAEIEDVESYDDDERQESTETLAKLAKLAEDLNQSCDTEDADSVAEALDAAMNNYGPTLISEDHFVDAMKQDMEDFGYISSDVPWFITNNIDWDGVADDLKSDYTSVTFDGEDYYIR